MNKKLTSNQTLEKKRKEGIALLKIKRFAQVTLPPDLRKRFNLAEGDYVEAEAVEDGILLKPVTVIERKKAWGQVFQAMASVKERKPRSKKTPRDKEEEIAKMVKEFRKRP